MTNAHGKKSWQVCVMLNNTLSAPFMGYEPTLIDNKCSVSAPVSLAQQMEGPRLQPAL